MKTAVKGIGILSEESEGKTLEFDLYMLDCRFQAFAIIFNCLHCAMLLQCQRNCGSFSNKMGKKYFVYINSQSDTTLQVTGRKKTLLISGQV